MPPAPPMFSTITCWPSRSESFCPISRPMKSIGPPAGKGTTKVIGRVGHSCATAGPPSTSAINAAITALRMRLSLVFLRPHGEERRRRVSNHGNNPGPPHPSRRRFAPPQDEGGLTASVDHRAAALDRRRPALGFGDDELPQIFRRAALLRRHHDADRL